MSEETKREKIGDRVFEYELTTDEKGGKEVRIDVIATDLKFHIEMCAKIARLEFPGVVMQNLEIDFHVEQFDCFGYDLIDLNDYKTFVYMRAKAQKKD